MKFRRGKKNGYLPKDTILSERNLKSLEYKRRKQNPIVEAKRFKKYIEEHPGIPYWHIGELFGISKARLSQLISLTTKLPSKITDFIEEQSDPDFLCFFTERRLRELTKLDNKKEKIKVFKQLIETFNYKNDFSIVF